MTKKAIWINAAGALCALGITTTTTTVAFSPSSSTIGTSIHQPYRRRTATPSDVVLIVSPPLGRRHVQYMGRGGDDLMDEGLRKSDEEETQEKQNESPTSPDNNDNPSNNSNNGQPKQMTDAEFDRAVRLRRAQMEYDKLMSNDLGTEAYGPPPFDRDAEIAKLVPGGKLPPYSKLEEAERTFEEEVSNVEAALYDAATNEDYTTAMSKSEELSNMHLDDCGAVLQVNSHFYRAFSEKNYDLMSDLWLHDTTVHCVHPSHPPLIGADNVLESWKKMFNSDDNTFQKNWMEPSNVHLAVRGTTAIVTCDEEVYTRRYRRGKKRTTELVNKLVATNVYRKVGGKWKMVHHHASWHSESDAAKVALNVQKSADGTALPGGGGVNSKKRRQQAQNIRSISRMSDLSGGGDLNGMLGGLGGLSGNGSGSDGEGPPAVKRVFMGSLNDLLNGGLSDILSNEISNSNNGDDDGQTIIHFQGQIEEEEDIDDEDDDDDDDDDDESDAVTLIKEWAKGGGSTSKSNKKSNGEIEPKEILDVQTTSESTTSGSSSSSSSATTKPPKDALRQSCISALRKLATQGSISSKQKRVLLTDIISCSARGEFSMVEVAYELLCGECDDDEDDNDKDMAEEEFADQCRAFATSLPEVPGISATSS